MSDLPPPDIRDQSGRARRLVLALIAGAAAAAAAYAITYGLADPEHEPTVGVTRYAYGASRFVFYMTAFAGAAVFGATLAFLNMRAKKKYREQLVAQAKVVKDR